MVVRPTQFINNLTRGGGRGGCGANTINFWETTMCHDRKRAHAARDLPCQTLFIGLYVHI